MDFSRHFSNLKSYLLGVPKRKLFISVLVLFVATAGIFLVTRQIFKADINGSYTISGQIYGQDTKKILADVDILLSSPSNIEADPISTKTDASGRYSISAPSSDFTNISITKDGYWDIEGVISDYIPTSPTERKSGFRTLQKDIPLPVVLNLDLKPGFGKEDTQIIVTKAIFRDGPRVSGKVSTIFGVSLEPFDKSPASIVEIIPQAQGDTYTTKSLSSSFIYLNQQTGSEGSLFRGQVINCVIKTTQSSLSGQFPDNGSRTIIIRGRAKTETATFQTVADKDFYLADPFMTDLKLADIQVKDGADTYSLTDAKAKGLVSENDPINLNTNGYESVIDNLNDTTISQGNIISFKAKKSVGLEVAGIDTSMASSIIPIDDLTVDGKKVQVQDIWLLSMHPVEGEETPETLQYLDNLDQALTDYKVQYAVDHPGQANSAVDVIDYSFNNKLVSDPYYDYDALAEAGLLSSTDEQSASSSLPIAEASSAGNSFAELSKARANRDPNKCASDSISDFSIGGKQESRLFYCYSSKWKNDKTWGSAVPALLTALGTKKMFSDGKNYNVYDIIKENFSEPFLRSSAQRRYTIKLEKTINKDTLAAVNESDHIIIFNIEYFKKYGTANDSLQVPINYGLVHELLHTVRGKIAYSGAKYDEEVIFFAYEEGQVDAFARQVGKMFSFHGSLNATFYEQSKQSLNRAKNLSELKTWHRRIFNGEEEAKNWFGWMLYNYYATEWTKMTATHDEFFSVFNNAIRPKVTPGGLFPTSPNPVVDSFFKNLSVEGKPFYNWMNPISRKAFTWPVYYNPALLQKIISANAAVPKQKHVQSHSTNTLKILTLRADQIGDDTVSFELAAKGIGNYIFEGLSTVGIPSTLFSEDNNRIPNQTLRVVAYDPSNNVLGTRDYTTNENGEFYLPRYDLATDGRVRFQIFWKRNGQMNFDYDYNFYDSTTGNLGFYGVTDVPSEGTINIASPSGGTVSATVSRGVFHSPATKEVKDEFDLTYRATGQTPDTITKPAGSDYYTVINTDIQSPSFSGDVTIQKESSTTTKLNFNTSESVSGVIEYGKTTDFGQTKYFDEVTDTQSVMLENLELGETYFYKVFIVDRAGNYQDDDGNPIFKEGTFPDFFDKIAATSTCQDKACADNPYSINDLKASGITVSAADISWETSSSTTGLTSIDTLEYGLELPYTMTATARAESTVKTAANNPLDHLDLIGRAAAAGFPHNIHLTGLQMGKEYHYRIKSVFSDGRTFYSADRTFTTQNITMGPLSVTECRGVITASFTSAGSFSGNAYAPLNLSLKWSSVDAADVTDATLPAMSYGSFGFNTSTNRFEAIFTSDFIPEHDYIFTARAALDTVPPQTLIGEPVPFHRSDFRLTGGAEIVATELYISNSLGLLAYADLLPDQPDQEGNRTPTIGTVKMTANACTPEETSFDVPVLESDPRNGIPELAGCSGLSSYIASDIPPAFWSTARPVFVDLTMANPNGSAFKSYSLVPPLVLGSYPVNFGWDMVENICHANLPQ